MKNGSFIWLRVLGAIVALGLIAGAGALGYRVGFAQGVAQAPAVANAIEKAAERGLPAPQMMSPRGFGYGYFPAPFHRGFFNPIGAICFSVLFLLLFFGAVKLIFFRGAPWGWRPEGGVPSMFNEWHKRAHGEAPESEERKKE